MNTFTCIILKPFKSLIRSLSNTHSLILPIQTQRTIPRSKVSLLGRSSRNLFEVLSRLLKKLESIQLKASLLSFRILQRQLPTKHPLRNSMGLDGSFQGESNSLYRRGLHGKIMPIPKNTLKGFNIINSLGAYKRLALLLKGLLNKKVPSFGAFLSRIAYRLISSFIKISGNISHYQGSPSKGNESSPLSFNPLWFKSNKGNPNIAHFTYRDKAVWSNPIYIKRNLLWFIVG